MKMQSSVCYCNVPWTGSSCEIKICKYRLLFIFKTLPVIMLYCKLGGKHLTEDVTYQTREAVFHPADIQAPRRELKIRTGHAAK